MYNEAISRGRKALEQNSRINIPFKSVDPGMSRKDKDSKQPDFKPIGYVYEGNRM